MTANVNPIFLLTPDVSNNGGTVIGGSLLTAANDYTGVSANYVLEFTAGANGGYIERLRFKPLGTNIQTVARIFLNNGSTPGTASNNAFYDEITLPATTASTTAQTGPSMDLQMNLRIPAAWRVYTGLTVTVASGWQCIAVGGQY